MGSTDQHSQLKASYSTSHPIRRVWWPLFFNMIDAASVNVYVIHKAISERPLTHRKCQLAINREMREKGYRELLTIHITGGLKSLRQMKWPKKTPKGCEEDSHRRIAVKRDKYKVCLQKSTRGTRGNRGALVTISGNVDKSSITTRISVTGCDVCRVPLCSNEYC
jgi:hypothetical protein